MIEIDGVRYARPHEVAAVLPDTGVTPEIVRDWCRDQGGKIRGVLRAGRNLLVPVDELYRVERETRGIGRRRSCDPATGKKQAT